MQSSSSTWIAVAALSVASVALAWGWTGGRSSAAESGGRLAVPSGDPSLDAILERIALLERRLDALEVSELEPVASPREAERVVSPALEPEEMREMVGGLVRDALGEQRLPRYLEGSRSRFVPGGNPDPEASRRLVQESIALANDGVRTAQERLDALRLLRFRQSAGEDARLSVVDAMVHLGLTSPDGAVRADVWRQMSGVTDGRLLQPLLDALAYDTEAEVREEAAETLIDYLPDATVLAALQHAAEHDPDEQVRRQAGVWRRRRKP